MAPSKTPSFVKPSLSQLLLRSLEKLDDPKYATVPPSHTDEVRPSILEQYQQYTYVCEEKKKDCYKQTADVKCCNTEIRLEQTCSRAKAVSIPLTLRALNWSIEPLWRYCASKIHLELEQGAKQIVSGKNGKHLKKDSKSSSLKKSFSQLPITSKQNGKTKVDLVAPNKSAAGNNILTNERELLNQCSHAAFEVLPPLFESRTHTLLYQNSYLLDGVKYDYGSNKNNQEQSVSTKLRLNYLKFLKSVNERTKPTDGEVIFGEAKVILNPPPHWEKSRIDWLMKLEQQQEERKRQYLEENQQLKSSGEHFDLTRAFHLKYKKRNNSKNKSKRNEKVKNVK